MFKNLFKSKSKKEETKQKEDKSKKEEEAKSITNSKIISRDSKENNLKDSSDEEQSFIPPAPVDTDNQVQGDKKRWTFDPNVDPKKVFTKLKVLGKGGFGTVLQIVHRPTMKVLAGKLINPNLVDENTNE